MINKLFGFCDYNARCFCFCFLLRVGGIVGERNEGWVFSFFLLDLRRRLRLVVFSSSLAAVVTKELCSYHLSILKTGHNSSSPRSSSSHFLYSKMASKLLHNLTSYVSGCSLNSCSCSVSVFSYGTKNVDAKILFFSVACKISIVVSSCVLLLWFVCGNRNIMAASASIWKKMTSPSRGEGKREDGEIDDNNFVCVRVRRSKKTSYYVRGSNISSK